MGKPQGGDRPSEVHASQGLKVGLYTPTILGMNSHLSWFHDRGVIKDPAYTGTSKRLYQAKHRGPIRKFPPKYANVYVTIQSHCLSAGAQTHYVTANGVRNGLGAGGTDREATNRMTRGRLMPRAALSCSYCHAKPHLQ